MVIQKERQNKEEEMKGVTFKPNIKPKKYKHRSKLSKNIDPKQYLNPDSQYNNLKNLKYSENI